jgi:AcrR family transcriptional regulator
MISEPASPQHQRSGRKRRSDGERSRNAILEEAARLATIEGIGGLSISRLAEAVGMSKSGLFAHFGSKEELQLATIEKADAVFAAQVFAPAAGAADGLDRLRRLAEAYLRYVESDTFPGGCFFASVLVEVDMQPGPVRERVVRFLNEWLHELTEAIRTGQAEGTIAADEDPDQLAFDIEAALFLANAQFAVTHSPLPLKHARHLIDRRLANAATGVAA